MADASTEDARLRRVARNSVILVEAQHNLSKPVTDLRTMVAACDLFADLGTVFAFDSEKEFDAICATTATIASYCAFAERIASGWRNTETENRRPESTLHDCLWGYHCGRRHGAAQFPIISR
jgi:hypothetical protein